MGLRTSISLQQEIDHYKLEWKRSELREKVLILVEGKDDVLFYFKFFNHDNTEIRSVNGCQRIELVRQGIEDNTDIVSIVIKDSDFARLNGNLSECPNVFYADAHDYEMMCIKNKQVRHDLLENNGVVFDERLFDKTFDDLRLLSYFQWYNYTNRLGYEASEVGVGDKEDAQLRNFQNIHDEIVQKTKWARQKKARKNGEDPSAVIVLPIEKADIDKFIAEHPSPDKYEVTRGHGFLTRFKKNVKPLSEAFCQQGEKDIKKVLHPCFSIDHFKSTNLYNSLLIWQTNVKKEILVL